MKLRFGIDAAARARIRSTLDQRCAEPAVGRRLAYVYLDTPDGALAARGVALRFRRSAALGTPAPRRAWRRQEVWPKRHPAAGTSLKKLGIPHLKQRLDATFTVRIERWTWALDDGPAAAVSLDAVDVATGDADEHFAELRIVCRKKDADAAMRFAVGLGALHLASVTAKDRGAAMMARA